MPVNDGAWHHICVTWENTQGSWNLYKDGAVFDYGRGLLIGHEIIGGGVLVLGQEQDELEGGFVVKQSFIGSLTAVEVWDHVISPDDISRMSKACKSSIKGNVITWFDFKSGVRGDMQVVGPSSCHNWQQQQQKSEVQTNKVRTR